MIAWWWLIPAFALGFVFAFLVAWLLFVRLDMFDGDEWSDQ